MLGCFSFLSDSATPILSATIKHYFSTGMLVKGWKKENFPNLAKIWRVWFETMKRSVRRDSLMMKTANLNLDLNCLNVLSYVRTGQSGRGGDSPW